MKCLRLATVFLLIIWAKTSWAQSDFVMLGTRQYDVLNRLEIKLRKDSILNFSAVKPYDRKAITERLQYIQQLANEGKIELSKVDKYNLDIVLKDNFEWRNGFADSSLKFSSLFKKSIWSHPPYIGLKQKDFSAYVFPLLNLQLGKDNNVSNTLYTNQRGFGVRGTLTKRVGYYTYFTSNQEVDPLYVQQYSNKYSAIPGAGYIKHIGTNGFDYFDARGGLMVNAAKGIDLQFAYDKVFIGNGYRSLILSNFSNSFLYLKANFHFWKLNYYNLFAQQIATHVVGPDYEYPKKYMTFHMLEYNAKSFTLGFYENIMFGRSNGYELAYLNPFILSNQMQRDLGSPDKATIGFNAKWNISKSVQLYGQFVINEFLMKEFLKPKNGYWANKQAYQIGLKKIDLFTVKNLDLQLEANFIRPFVYTHYDSVSAYTHYNQPLAHPLGANLREFISILKYQPANKLSLEAKVIYTEQGLDSAGVNMGSNIFELYTTRPRDYGFFIGTGILAKTFTFSGTVTYEFSPNIFLDVNMRYRKYSQADGLNTLNSSIFNASLRINLGRREFDF